MNPRSQRHGDGAVVSGSEGSSPRRRGGPGRGHRGAKGKELTPAQKRFNKRLSKARVVVEHTIPRMKKFNIMGQEFRNRLRHYDLMMDIVPGLINFRMMGSKGLLL